jgi:hypothetical protein
LNVSTNKTGYKKKTKEVKNSILKELLWWLQKRKTSQKFLKKK